MSVSCTGKIRFETFAGANRAARRALRKGRDGRALAAYACRECHGFHVGSHTGRRVRPTDRERKAFIGGYDRSADRLSEDDQGESG